MHDMNYVELVFYSANSEILDIVIAELSIFGLIYMGTGLIFIILLDNRLQFVVKDMDILLLF